jgi:hypothetical protein
MQYGAFLILQERNRQKTEKGFTDAHDDSHLTCELACGGICSAALAVAQIMGTKVPQAINYLFFANVIPLKECSDPIINLVKAGALIAAEIDRLQRLKEKTEEAAGTKTT